MNYEAQKYNRRYPSFSYKSNTETNCCAVHKSISSNACLNLEHFQIYIKYDHNFIKS